MTVNGLGWGELLYWEKGSEGHLAGDKRHET